MAQSEVSYTGDGTTVLFSFTFPYLKTTDIKVSVNGVNSTAFTLANTTTIEFNTAPANGAAIRIFRFTDNAELAATFFPGSAIRAQDLNDNFVQNLYVTQEAKNDSNAVVQVANLALSNSTTAISTANSATTVANSISGTASSAVSIANAASSTAQDAVLIATSAAAPQSTMQVLEPYKILSNASTGIGVPGTIPFGVGPVLASGQVFAGINQSDYYPIHLLSGSYC
jgi:hypothetical protein